MNSIQKILRQQTAIAEFGSYAFGEKNVARILDRACIICSELLGANFSKICEYNRRTKHLVVVAGHGWNEGVIGYTYAISDKTSPQVRAFETELPVFSHVKNSAEFQFPAFYKEHKVNSTIDIIIKGKKFPYGVLELDSIKRNAFDEYDINFLTSFTNILAQAIRSAKKTRSLQQSIKKRDRLIDEKSALIEQKSLLTAELHHRVRNNLQIIHSMLISRMDELGPDEDSSHVTLRKIASRVMAMAHVYDQLLVSGSEKGISIAAYMKGLIGEIVQIYGSTRPSVELVSTIDDVELNLDRASVLGLITTELLTNAYMHAFPKGVGTIQITLKVSVHQKSALLCVSDDGIGFDAFGQNKRTGIKLIRLLVDQMGGTLDISTVSGTKLAVQFPL